MMWEAEGVLVRFYGDLTNGDFFESNQELFLDERFPNSRYSLCDFSEVTQFSITSQAVMETAELDREHSKRNPNFKIATVVNDIVMFGLMRVYKTTTDQQAFETEVFETLEDARKWLEC